MGEDEWTHREPGSATGSVVPPPAAAEEPPPSRSPLPRRQPKASGHQRSADADELITPVRRVCGSPGPELSVTRSVPPGEVAGTEGSAEPRGLTGSGGTGSLQRSQRRLHLAQPPEADQPQLPDNVRYLFRPLLPGTSATIEPAAGAAGAAAALDADTEAESGPNARRDAGTVRLSAGSAGAPADGQPRRQPDGSRPGPELSPTRERNLARRPSPDPEASPACGSRPARDADKPRPRRRPSWVASAGHHRHAAAVGANQLLLRRVTWAAAILIVIVAVAGTTFALIGRASRVPGQASHGARNPVRGTSGQTGAKAITGLSAAAITRGEATRWIAKEISSSAIIACDDVMCSELFNQGLAASNLLVLSPTAPDPLGADVVVGTPALRSQFGPRLAREYAPTVIASFGAGQSRVDVRVVAPYGAAAYEAAFNHDLAARQRFGGVLLHNSRIGLSASAQPDLIGGLVDPRLLSMFPVLAGQHPIEILGFYDRAPRSAQGVPMTGVELAGNDTAAGLSAGSYLRWLLVFLRGQRAPYRPTSVAAAFVGGREVVRVRFARPSPLGLLSGQ